jgi:hypothetical protein
MKPISYLFEFVATHVAVRNVHLSLLVAAICLALPAPSGAASGVVFDNMSTYESGNTNAGISATSSTPNTFMGSAYTLTAGTYDITGFDIFPVNLSGTAYVGLKISIFVWGSVNMGAVNATTPAFGNLLNSYTFTSSGSFNNGFYFPFEGSPVGSGPGISLGSPLAIPSTTVGITFNFQGTTDGTTYNNVNSLTSLISYGVPPTVGSEVFNGYYRNANSEVNGNFTSSLRSLGFQDQSLALRVFGDFIVPEPTALSLLGLGAGLLAFRRRRQP